MNGLYLYRHAVMTGVTLKIGSKGNGRWVSLSDDEALKLAYRLMSLAKGGETQGAETFKAEQP